ncbi:hypothetical protein CBL_20162, partial [Carabus blaptoides fortunei]
ITSTQLSSDLTQQQQWPHWLEIAYLWGCSRAFGNPLMLNVLNYGHRKLNVCNNNDRLRTHTFIVILSVRNVWEVVVEGPYRIPRPRDRELIHTNRLKRNQL